jgi:hypothetical protein
MLAFRFELSAASNVASTNNVDHRKVMLAL